MSNTQLILKWQDSPLEFVRDVWGLEPSIEGGEFILGRHLTWQQVAILKAVGKARTGEGLNKISVASGNGIGKSACLAWLTLWHLFCFPQSQVRATAPSSDQLYDVLWKECAKWLAMMPGPIRNCYEWTMTHIRMKAGPNVWFASARTARKETPEAFSGVHGEFVMLLGDEASGIEEEIYQAGEGVLASQNVLVILVSNPTRLVGYFYDTHYKFQKHWQTLSFSSEDSPIVPKSFIEEKIARYGIDSDDYRIFVQGKFPNADAVDEKGYVPLFQPDLIRQVADVGSFNEPWLGIDPAGEGRNESVWVVRDYFRAKIVARERVSDTESIVRRTRGLMDHYGIGERKVVVDNFGTGANVSQELALLGYKISAVNVGDEPYDRERYVNLRSEAYWKLREWLQRGGELVRSKDWEQLRFIRYRRIERNGYIQVMPKAEMPKMGYPSPDAADALMLTWAVPEPQKEMQEQEVAQMTNVYG